MALDNFIPRNAMMKCLRCKKYFGKFACEVYPKRIPNEVIEGACPEQEVKAPETKN